MRAGVVLAIGDDGDDSGEDVDGRRGRGQETDLGGWMDGRRDYLRGAVIGAMCCIRLESTPGCYRFCTTLLPLP